MRLWIVTAWIGMGMGLLLGLGGCTRSPSPEPRVLHLYCWSNYFSPEVVAEFEKVSGARVVMDYFASNEELLAKLQAGARGYDLIVPSSYMVPVLKNLGLIQPLGAASWEEWRHLSARFASPRVDPKQEWAVPYAWGTTGIAVNRDVVREKIDSWAWLFERPEYRGRITMLDDAVTVVGTALKYLGYSYNDGSAEALARVRDLLIRQKKGLKAYTPESQPVLVSGEAALVQAYSGDVLQVKNRDKKNVEYVFPREGGELFVDYLAIPQGAPAPDLARQFMRLTLQKKMAALQVRHLYFGPVVDLQGTPEAQPILGDPVIFPASRVLDRFELMEDDPKRLEAIQRLWTELKST